MDPEAQKQIEDALGEGAAEKCQALALRIIDEFGAAACENVPDVRWRLAPDGRAIVEFSRPGGRPVLVWLDDDGEKLLGAATIAGVAHVGAVEHGRIANAVRIPLSPPENN